jgi:putative transposase
LELDSKIQTSKDITSIKKKIKEFIIDETLIKVGSELIWLWVVIEFESKRIVGITISKERNMFVAERLLSKIVVEYGKYPVSSDGGTWYPQACRFLNLKHHLLSSFKKGNSL